MCFIMFELSDIYGECVITFILICIEYKVDSGRSYASLPFANILKYFHSSLHTTDEDDDGREKFAAF